LHWENAIHECIAVPFQRGLRLPEIYIEHRPLPEKKIHKVDRNLRILSKEYNSGERSPRTLFYYASELRDHARHVEAVPVFEDYLNVSNVAWEKYEALIRLADCLQKIEQPDLALERLMQAIALDSTRAEAFNKAGLYFYHRECWRQAIPFFTAAMALPRPSDGFIDDAHYTWMPPDYLSICYDRLKNYPQAIAFTMQALQSSPDKARLIKNMHWFVDQL
jgi:tetratricopeptide (TPR) repeat protein